MSDDKDRIRQRAYQIWLEEGRPEGREAIHWHMAREYIAIEDAQTAATRPARRHSGGGKKAATTPKGVSPPGKTADKKPAVAAASRKAPAQKRTKPKTKSRGGKRT